MSEPRHTDEQYDALLRSLNEHVKQDVVILEQINAKLSTIESLIPDLREVVTRWHQAKGIFWFIIIVSAMIAAFSNAFDWVLSHLKVK